MVQKYYFYPFSENCVPRVLIFYSCYINTFLSYYVMLLIIKNYNFFNIYKTWKGIILSLVEGEGCTKTEYENILRL